MKDLVIDYHQLRPSEPFYALSLDVRTYKPQNSSLLLEVYHNKYAFPFSNVGTVRII